MSVINRLNFGSALRTAANDAEFRKRLEASGSSMITDARLGAAEHKKFLETEIAQWGPVSKAAGQ